MNTDSVLKHLLNDGESLEQYLSKQLVTFEDINRRMFLRERSENRLLPDHYYRLLTEVTFNGITNISGIFSKGLVDLADKMLGWSGNLIIVKTQQQHQWQEKVTYLPPLVLKSALISKRFDRNWNNAEDVRDFFDNIILPNFQYTALASPSIKQLDEFIKLNRGFHDLHMHLNGSTETDVAWQDYLDHPDKIYAELQREWVSGRVKELLEQESSLLEPNKFKDLLMIARRLRNMMYDLINAPESENAKLTINQILIKVQKLYTPLPEDSLRNPFFNLIADKNVKSSKLAVEALMFVRVLNHIALYPDDHCKSLFHFYLLILGLCNRLLVQQTHQYGFEQFQKLTINGMREFSELEYASRFQQIQGNQFQNFGFLEGRFSPKENEEKLVGMLNKINGGWSSMLDTLKLSHSDVLNKPDLKLVAHFIKRAEGINVDSRIRHKWLRNEIWDRGKVLAILLKNHPQYKKLVVGIDAASSEFDAPPEVFAPLFRKLRRSEIHNFTYHAGEDFHHLVSGLRAIFEAIEFTEMMPNNRIGHAVATGLAPNLWLSAVGNRLLIRRGEWLDNLIFIYYLINSYGAGRLEHLKDVLPGIIIDLAESIYDETVSLEQLIEAWLNRKFEPMLLLAKSREEAANYSVFDAIEWNEIKNASVSEDAKRLIRKYHDEKFRKAYEGIIEITPDDLLTAKTMEICQQIILKIMSDRLIIIEALPTSNVRIGHHRSFQSYHLWNWLKFRKEKHPIPPIVIGTDDTGIFATNILNEYANVYLHLTEKQSENFAMKSIKEFESNSLKYRFSN
ncbi:hypothetical protein ACFQZX_00455 [Mucilaginibacter litoreus]|uniref:Adenosine deaminase n=1 Tax=Mucilaginibacter litoreus TaxID=1048221 RepID=A0ABW3AM41_9SPHI